MDGGCDYKQTRFGTQMAAVRSTQARDGTVRRTRVIPARVRVFWVLNLASCPCQIRVMARKTDWVCLPKAGR